MPLLVAIFLGLSTLSVQAQEPIRLYAAGSLCAALSDAAAAFERSSGSKVAGTFGASGLLKERIEKGEAADVFASANMEHPEALSRAGRSGGVSLFARNRLCALAGPAVKVDSATLLDSMLDPAVKLGTSTPKADPSGDYAWQLFERAERVRPGARAVLEKKALQLTGGPNSPRAPDDRSIYGMLVEKGEADIFLTYCTGALQAKADNQALQIVQVPATLAVAADYGLTVMKAARPDAERFAQFILSPAGQAILATYGFSPGSSAGGR
jgi:molybdate transport system substrate-binding protein